MRHSAVIVRDAGIWSENAVLSRNDPNIEMRCSCTLAALVATYQAKEWAIISLDCRQDTRIRVLASRAGKDKQPTQRARITRSHSQANLA
jgi:hypothetical protein